MLQTVDLVDYPESDGKPMAETDVHRACMVRIHDMLQHRYRGQNVYVGSNLLIYWIRGDNTASVAPDNFVVLNCQPGHRRTFRTWDERRSPDVVFEITSRSTRGEDERSKPAIYARLGVKEYFLFDPTSEYLDPRLKGFRLVAGAYQPIKADKSGSLTCRTLKLTLHVEDEALVLRDRKTGEILPTEAEAAQLQRQAEQKKRQAEQKKRRAEQKKRQAAETARAAAEAERNEERTAREEAESERDAERAAREAAETRALKLEEELKRLRAASKPDHPHEA